jgi:hypothetical protein
MHHSWNVGKADHDCSKQPFTKVLYGKPTSKTPSASGGEIGSIYGAGACISKLSLNTTQTDVDVMFKVALSCKICWLSHFPTHPMMLKREPFMEVVNFYYLKFTSR